MRDYREKIMLGVAIICSFVLLIVVVYAVNAFIHERKVKRETEVSAVSISTLTNMVNECKNVNKYFTQSELNDFTTTEAIENLDKCRELAATVRKQKEIEKLSNPEKSGQ